MFLAGWFVAALTQHAAKVLDLLAREEEVEPCARIVDELLAAFDPVSNVVRTRDELEALYAGEDDSSFVLRTRRETPLSRHNAARTIREAGEKAKLGHVTPHTLRRTTGTALSEARVPEADAAAIMGHSIEVFHGSYVKAHRDAIARDQAREALLEIGLGVTPA